MIEIIHGDNLPVLRGMPDGAFDFVYVDPPFNTGRKRTFVRTEAIRTPDAPRLVGPEKAARGKTPTDVWWHTIVPTGGRERTGYPTQKPLGILERLVRVHTRPGDRILDFFAGSGTTGEAAARHGRHAVLVDERAEAIEVMRSRLAFADPVVREGAAHSGA